MGQQILNKVTTFQTAKNPRKKKTKSSWSSQKIWTISTVSTGFFYRSNSPPTRLAVGHRSTLSVQLTDFTWWHQWKWGDHDLHDFRRHEKPVWGAKNPWILGFPIEKPPSTHQSCQLSCQPVAWWVSWTTGKETSVLMDPFNTMHPSWRWFKLIGFTRIHSTMKTEREREMESMSYTYTCSIVCAHFIYIISYHTNVYINTVNVWFMDMYVNTIKCVHISYIIYIYYSNYMWFSHMHICFKYVYYIYTLHMYFYRTQVVKIASGPSAPQLHIPERTEPWWQLDWKTGQRDSQMG